MVVHGIRRFCLASIASSTMFMSMSAAFADVSWAVLDAGSGRFLGQEKAAEIHPPASLAKMMTLYLTFEAIRAGRLKWDDRIVVSRNASIKIPMKLRVKPGNTISVREAVNGMIVISANDAAAAIGEHLAGSEAAFARLMTQRAKRLGLKDTVFTNPSGLTDGRKQSTTARDMALLGLALQRDFPAEYALFSQRSFVFRGKLLRGHNNLMYRYDGVDGIKTGFTSAAGYNIVSSYARNNRHLIGVVLGGKTARKRDDRMEALLTRFATQGTATGGSLQQMVMNVPVPTWKPHHPSGRADLIDETLIEQGDGGLAALDPSGWQIQIAAVPSRATAQGLLARAGKFVRAVNGKATGQIEPTEKNGTTLYRARFDCFADGKAAGKACAILKRQKFDCFAINLP